MINFLGLVLAIILAVIVVTSLVYWLIFPVLKAASFTIYSMKLAEQYPEEVVDGWSALSGFFAAYIDMVKGYIITESGPWGYWRGIGDWKVYPKK